MPSPNQAQMRIRIAQQAAQLVAEHGIRDYALAKRKAARQLGAPDSHSLPSNDEIDEALRAYHALYAPDSHGETLAALRRQALEALRVFTRFEPVLIGPVLEGTASDHSAIQIELYADASKEFEQFLLNQGAEFKASDRNGRQGFLIYSEPADLHVTVLPQSSRHAASRGRQDPLRRATAEQLERIMQAEASEDGAPPK